MSWPARYAGPCAADCGEPIEKGQEIETVSSSGLASVSYRHVVCPDADVEPRPTRFVGTTDEEMGY